MCNAIEYIAWPGLPQTTGGSCVLEAARTAALFSVSHYFSDRGPRTRQARIASLGPSAHVLCRLRSSSGPAVSTAGAFWTTDQTVICICLVLLLHALPLASRSLTARAWPLQERCCMAL